MKPGQQAIKGFKDLCSYEHHKNGKFIFFYIDMSINRKYTTPKIDTKLHPRLTCKWCI